MSFLQINNANPSEKRPFRLSDIQDIWSGIKSLFTAISGQQFRVISGFDLVTVNGLEQYSAGVVWYNGNLYEYDPALYGRITPYDDTFFYRVAIDNRTWEGGAIQPFAYKYACGTNFIADGVDRELITVDTFARHVEKYKSFLGDGSVTTAKLADQSVTEEKIGFLYTPAIPHNRSDNVKVSAGSTTLITEFMASNLYLRAFEINGGTTHTIVVNASGTRSLYSTLPLMVLNNTSTTVTINFTCSPASDYKPSQTIQTISIPANTKKVIPLYHVVPTLNGASPIYVVADTAF